MNVRRLNLYAFLIAIAMITYWHMKRCKELPWPPQYIYTALVFALLDIVSFFNEEIAGVSSIGMVLGIFFVEAGTIGQGHILGTTFTACEHGGTGQPQTTGFISTNYGGDQPPSAASMDYQTGAAGQTAAAIPPPSGTQVV